MKKVEKYSLIILLGGSGYGSIEIAFRGYTHWSMIITGGMALLMLYFIYNAIPSSSVISKAIIGSVSITALEFTVGIIVNKIFPFGVWDYSNLPLNFLGQISLIFSACWFMLSAIVFKAMDLIKRLLHSRNFENLYTVRRNRSHDTISNR